jgi:hypothetical protein
MVTDLCFRDFENILVHFYSVLTKVEVESSHKNHLGLEFSEDALRLFGGFLLLRFICPAIVSPLKYELISHGLIA